MSQRLDVTITYLEQRARPTNPPPPKPAIPTAIMRAVNPPLHYYRYLYKLVGEPWNWVSRLQMSDEELSAIILHPDVYVYVLYVAGVPNGLAEIDGRDPKTCELKFFGLSPDCTGRGLGRFFLYHALDLAWSLNPEKLVLETCTLDHPAALPLYQKTGFTVSDRKQGTVELLITDPD